MAVSGAPGPNGPDADPKVFVGREETLTAVDLYVQKGEGPFRRAAVGTWGIGKSSLVGELQRRVEAGDQSTAIRLQLSTYRPLDTRPGRDPSTKRLVLNFDRYCEFLGDLAEAGRSRAFKELEQSVAVARQAVATHQAINFSPTVEIGDDAKFGDDADVGSFTYVSGEEDPKLDGRILAERSRLTAEFVQTLGQAGRDYGVVLLLDDLDRIHGHLVASWVLELVCHPGLDSVAVLVTAGPGGVDLDGPGRLRREELERFSAHDVEDYLRRRLGSADAALVDQVMAFSRGLPHAVTMAGDVMAQRQGRGLPADLDDVADHEWSPDSARLLSTIVAELADEDDRTILRKGRLARRLDAAVVGALLSGAGAGPPVVEAERVQAVGERLVRYSFVDAENDPDLGRSFRFHHYIQRLGVTPAPALEVDADAVHRALAAHYEQRLEAYDEDEAASKTPYGCYYKYEHAGWQKLVREWAHHAAQIRAPADQQRARAYLARMFLDAFWWWGCYVKFPFCEGLLDEWDAAHAGGASEWSDLFRVILAAYPPGAGKEDQPGWPLVERALVQVRTATGIHSRSARLEPAPGEGAEVQAELAHRRRLRALTSLFLAHCYRFRTDQRPYARPFFDDALHWLARDGDDVGLAWTTFEAAELSHALGPDTWAAARAELATAARHTLDRNRGDYELLANLHRLDGDLRWSAGERDGAVDAAVRAVVRAYAFQVDPHPPDLYTVTFYEEVLGRLGDRLAAVAGRDGEEAGLAACRRALAGTSPVRLRGGPGDAEDAALRAALPSGGVALGRLVAPAPPSLDEAYTEGSSFVADACLATGVLSVRMDEEDAALAAPAPTAPTAPTGSGPEK